MAKAVGRNDPCPCGSGQKYKNCCLGKPPPEVRRRRALIPTLLALIAVGMGIWLGMDKGWITGLAVTGGGLMIAGIAFLIRDPPPPGGDAGGAAAINFGTKK